MNLNREVLPLRAVSGRGVGTVCHSSMFFCLLPDYAFAQSLSSLSGTITDERNAVVPGITVILKGTSLGVITDGRGKFAITDIQPSTYTIEISGVSYEKQTFQLTFNAGQTINRSMKLKESTSELEEVVVTTQSEAQALELSAKSVQVIETREVKLKSADLGEMMAQTEGVNVQRAGGSGSNTRFSLNGLSGDQIRFFYDGIPLNFTPYAFGIANVPVNAIDRVEIYKGVVPTQFGADALGGAVNLASSEVYDGWSGAASYQIGSFNTHRITGNINYADEKTGLFAVAGGFYNYTDNDYKIDVAIPNEQGQLQHKTVVSQNMRIESLDPSVEEASVDERSVSNYGAGNRLKYTWSPRFSTKLSYEYAYRLPRLNEIFGDGQLIQENLERCPESSHNVNLQWNYASKTGANTDWQLQGNFFLRRIDDLILLLVDANDFGSFQNVWSATSQGFELSGRWKNAIKGLTLSANTTYQEYLNTSETGSFESFEGDRIPNTPYFFANGAAEYELTDMIKKQDKLSIFWNVRYVNSFFEGWENAGLQQFKAEVPDQIIDAAGLTHRMNIKNIQNALTLEVQNLTNAKVFDFFGVQRPGRASTIQFYLRKATLNITNNENDT